MDVPEEVAYLAEFESPPSLSDASVPALDGWTGAEPSLGDILDAALDSLGPWGTRDRAETLSRALLQGNVRHILHVDGPEQSLTLRLDKYSATTLTALVEKAVAAQNQITHGRAAD